MKNLLSITCLMLISATCFAQQTQPKDPDAFLIGATGVPKVLLVGSWHFNYPGLDAHQTDESQRINIYTEKRQQELNELLDYLARFKPTKIMVESGPITGYLKYNYQEWKAGREQLRANEMSQIGMHLVDRLQLDTIYGVNDYPLLMDMYYDSSLTKIPYLDSIYQRHYFGGEDAAQQRYSAFYKYEETYEFNHTLLEGFKYLNSDKVLSRYNGAYLEGGQFASEGNEGPDALSMFWVNRNLRIFRNIQRISTTPDDRILVLFGAGHVAMLKWLFESSPAYHLIRFEALDKPPYGPK